MTLEEAIIFVLFMLGGAICAGLGILVGRYRR